MTPCSVEVSGAIDLCFYDELPPDERREVEQHVRRCSACREALAELTLIRASLSARPEIAAPAGGDWTRVMARIEGGIAAEAGLSRARQIASVRRTARVRFAMAGLALAAAVTFITAMTAHIARQPVAPSTAVASHVATPPSSAVVPARFDAAIRAQSAEAGLAAVSEQHFERSRLVILGLTARDARDASPRDWDYERRMAGSLLEDTRLYKQAAADRGMSSLAGVMSDLELVLLQTSLADRQDPATLARLQRLIRKRDLVTRMDVAGLAGRRPDLQVGRGER